MTTVDRLLLSLLTLTASALALREGEHLQQRRAEKSAIVVSVMGAVRQPGVVELPAGCRLAHAVDRCGGFTSLADTATVELARALEDGDHVVIASRPALRVTAPADLGAGVLIASSGGPEEASKRRPAIADQPANIESQTSEPRPDNAPPRRRRPEPPSEPIDINLASAEQLESLPGVGPVLAQRILRARQAAPGGTFGTLEELAAIRGIKAKTFSRLKPYLKIERQ